MSQPQPGWFERQRRTSEVASFLEKVFSSAEHHIQRKVLAGKPEHASKLGIILRVPNEGMLAALDVAEMTIHVVGVDQTWEEIRSQGPVGAQFVVGGQ